MSIGDVESSPEPDDISKFFFKEDFDDGKVSNDLDLNESVPRNEESDPSLRSVQDPWSLQSIMEAMDDELRTDAASDLSIKNLSVASVGGGGGVGTDDSDLAILSNL